MSEKVNVIEEDEIDLKELFYTIWKHKIKIVLFSFVVTSFTLVFVLSKPNLYSSKVILSPQEQSKGPSLGGLSSLAGLAGIDLGGGSGMNAITSLHIIFNDYNFNKNVIEKYKLYDQIIDPKREENLVFALGYKGAYELLNNKKDKGSEKDKEIDYENMVFETYRDINRMINISSDKKTSLITISVEHTDRFFAKYLLEIYLKESIDYIRKSDMIDLEKKLNYYNNELQNTQDIELKSQLSQLMSGLLQKKVLSKASELYIVKKVTEPRVSNIQEKLKPKRGLTLIVSFVTSIIIGIFGVFLLEFIRKDKKVLS